MLIALISRESPGLWGALQARAAEKLFLRLLWRGSCAILCGPSLGNSTVVACAPPPGSALTVHLASHNASQLPSRTFSKLVAKSVFGEEQYCSWLRFSLLILSCTLLQDLGWVSFLRMEAGEVGRPTLLKMLASEQQGAIEGV